MEIGNALTQRLRALGRHIGKPQFIDLPLGIATQSHQLPQGPYRPRTRREVVPDGWRCELVSREKPIEKKWRKVHGIRSESGVQDRRSMATVHFCYSASYRCCGQRSLAVRRSSLAQVKRPRVRPGPPRRSQYKYLGPEPRNSAESGL